MKKKIFMRAADALLLPNPPLTREEYQQLVKEFGLKDARNKRIEVEVEEDD